MWFSGANNNGYPGGIGEVQNLTLILFMNMRQHRPRHQKALPFCFGFIGDSFLILLSFSF